MIRIRSALIGMAVLGAWGAGGPAQAQFIDKTVTGEVYHYQVVDHYCASATIQMMLDCTAVRSTNAYINTYLTAADPAGIPHAPNHFEFPFQPIYAGGQVTFAPQVAIYNLIHGQATFTPIAGPNTGIPLRYFNAFTPWPAAGSGNNAIAWALNVYDNPAVGGIGTHVYSAYNVQPTIAGGVFASRTIANAITDYNVPAQVTIGSGAHSIAVTGVTSIGVPGLNQNYIITGFYVNDPWTGYWIHEILSGRPAPSVTPGLGEHQWLRYAYILDPFAPPIFIPGVGNVNAHPSPWFDNFNPAPAQFGEGPLMAAPGNKFVVEPAGAEPLDDGNGGIYSSFPSPSPLLSSPISTAADALAAATSDLASASYLNDEAGLQGGSFDLSGIVFLSAADGYGGEWVVPYDHSGSSASGAVLVNSLTGEIDSAMWTDKLADDLSDSQVDALYTSLNNGVFPDDNLIHPDSTTAVPPPVSRDVEFRVAGANPFRGSTLLSWSLPSELPVQIDVYTVTGERVETLANEVQGPGTHSARFAVDGPGRSLGAGIYFIHLRAGGTTRVLRVVALH